MGSTSALIAVIAALLAAWGFARVERLLKMRSQATLEKLVEQSNPLGKQLLLHAHSKRKVTLAAGTGRIVFSLTATALAAVQAHAMATQGILHPAAAYAAAALLCVIPILVIHLVLFDTATEDVGPGTVRAVGPVVIAWMLLFYPIVALLDRLLERASRHEDKDAREEALRAFVEEETEGGTIEEEKREMIDSIIRIDETQVREIMVPRVDMVAIDQERPISELVELFISAGHSRVPVYAGKVDNVVGIVYAKDALAALTGEGDCDQAGTAVREIMRGEASLLFVPTSNRIDDLLRVLRKEKKHMAIAVDEYGGVAGLVTMEDVLEEIVGEIQDEYDEEEELPYTWISEHQVVVDAGMDIADVNELLSLNLPDEEGYDTLGGFLYHRFSAIPEEGARTREGNHEFVVLSVDAQRINKVRVERLDAEEVAASTEATPQA